MSPQMELEHVEDLAATWAKVATGTTVGKRDRCAPFYILLMIIPLKTPTQHNCCMNSTRSYLAAV